MANAKGNVLLGGVVCAAWMASVGAGLFILMRYSLTPGPGSTPPETWPSDSSIPRTAHLPVLLMFIHPRCPCSRSSVGELAVLMRHCRGRVDARVVFVRPAGMPAGWERTDLWESARQIPGAMVLADEAGAEARHFGAATSGDVLLFDGEGALVFHGGITAARGHSGDNHGRDSVISLVNALSAASTLEAAMPLASEREQFSEFPARSTAVFGCDLFDTTSSISHPEQPECQH